MRYKRELLEPKPWGLGHKGPIHERKFVHVESEVKSPEVVLVQDLPLESLQEPTAT